MCEPCWPSCRSCSASGPSNRDHGPALERLAGQDPEQVRMIELRFFAGFTVEETAHVIECSPRTVKREWRLAVRGCTGSYGATGKAPAGPELHRQDHG